MKINCIIIDDEPLAIKVIENYLDKIKTVTVKGTFNNPTEALAILEEQPIDVIFLDVNMPEMSGLDFLKSISVKPQVIITTAYREYAVEGYNLNVLDYLVKPIPFDRFLRAIDKLKKQLESEHVAQQEPPPPPDGKSYIFLKSSKRLVKIDFDDILYVQGLRDYVKIYTELGEHIVHFSVTNILEKLPTEKFIRVHRSYVISLSKIDFIEGNSVEIGIKRIPIGRKYMKLTKQLVLNKKNKLR